MTELKNKIVKTSYQCCGSGMLFPDPRLLIFFLTGYRIPEPTTQKRRKNTVISCLTFYIVKNFKKLSIYNFFHLDGIHFVDPHPVGSGTFSRRIWIRNSWNLESDLGSRLSLLSQQYHWQICSKIQLENKSKEFKIFNSRQNYVGFGQFQESRTGISYPDTTQGKSLLKACVVFPKKKTEKIRSCVH
jgi:hypothetical protein